MRWITDLLRKANFKSPSYLVMLQREHDFRSKEGLHPKDGLGAFLQWYTLYEIPGYVISDILNRVPEIFPLDFDTILDDIENYTPTPVQAAYRWGIDVLWNEDVGVRGICQVISGAHEYRLQGKWYKIWLDEVGFSNNGGNVPNQCDFRCVKN